jgi:RHS repeat-associated protein
LLRAKLSFEAKARWRGTTTGGGLTLTPTFGYDFVNRLTSGAETNAAGAQTWAQAYNYDQYGNTWMPSTSLPAPPTGPAAPTANVYTASNNRNANSTYDASGNLTVFGSMSVSYDEENHQTAAGPNFYGFDGFGRRNFKTTASGTTFYLYDAFGQLAAEYAGGTVWQQDYIWQSGQVVAVENAAGGPCGTCYLSYDLLGSLRLVTDQNANVIARHDFAPFGQEIPAGVGARTSLWGATDGMSQRFTGQVRDTETGLDFFNARYMSSGLTRFTSADP